MPIVYSALIPHQPILVSTIGNAALEQAPLTRDGIMKARTLFHESRAETVIVITTPDTSAANERVIIQAPAQYRGTLETFGDFTTELAIPCDTVLAMQLKKDLEDSSLSVSFNSEEAMDYSASVPLSLLEYPTIKCIIVQPPACNMKKLIEFGERMQATLQRCEKRIACIASGDLAHCLTVSSPQKMRLEGTVIDQNIVLMFASRRLSVRKLAAFPRDAARDCGVCGLDAFTVLAGIIHHMNYRTRFHSYEGSLGVGLLIVSYLFS